MNPQTPFHVQTVLELIDLRSPKSDANEGTVLMIRPRENPLGGLGKH